MSVNSALGAEVIRWSTRTKSTWARASSRARASVTVPPASSAMIAGTRARAAGRVDVALQHVARDLFFVGAFESSSDAHSTLIGPCQLSRA